jgi:hypothetical protein
MTFARNLEPTFVTALNDEYQKNKKGWWHVLADDTDTLIAVRNNFLSVYRNGCSIAKIEHINGIFVVSVHYKFLLKKTIPHAYIPCTNGYPEIKEPYEIIIPSFTDMEDIIYWTDTLGGVEKTGVHRVIVANSNVIDTEIALTGEQLDENEDLGLPNEFLTSKRRSVRIDLCAIQGQNGKTYLRFFEAKHYSNKDLVTPSARPKVLDQLARYARQLKAAQTSTDILKAYKKSVELAHETANLLISAQPAATRRRGRPHHSTRGRRQDDAPTTTGSTCVGPREAPQMRQRRLSLRRIFRVRDCPTLN